MNNLIPPDFAWMALLLVNGKDTRYGLMVKANELLQFVHPPLKPGSFYPRLTKFERQKIISFSNQVNWTLGITSLEVYPADGLRILFENNVISYGIHYLEKMPIFWHIAFRSLLVYQKEDLLDKFLSLSKTRLYSLQEEIEIERSKFGYKNTIQRAINLERLGEMSKINKLLSLKN